MKVDIRVPVGLPVQETADFIAGCEAAGFSGVGVHDHQHSGRDVFVTLALAAERTSRLTLYPATSNPVTRHSMVLASLAHSLEEIAPERVRLTVGPGYLSVGNIGRPRATVAAMRRAVLTIRRLLRGERVEFNGVETRLRNLSPHPTPVFMTVAGPRMVELAGEVADGALLLVGLHPRAVDTARRRLEIGAARAGVNGGGKVDHMGGSIVGLRRWKTVPPAAFYKVDYQPLEGETDVSSGDVRSGAAGLHGGRHERSGSLPGVRPARDTVRKMLAYSVPPGYRREGPPRRPKLEAFTGVIDAILEGDSRVPRKQRHTAKRVFERLKDEYGFDGQYTIVKDYVRERGRRTQEMFVPLSHAPGHAQCDFGEAVAIVAGVERKVHYFVLDLPHSDGCFVKAYPAETTEAFLDGHVSAFALLGGAPQSILYDNTKLAVARILGDGRRKRTRAFTELQSHYLFEDRFGRPGKGNDKGKVEGMVGYARRNFLVPVPRVESFEALNAHLEQRCLERMDATLRGHTETIGQRMERDLDALLPLPAVPYDACDKQPSRVSSLSLVRYRTNDYSAPVAYGHREVLVRGYVDQVVISCGAEVIARHPRSYEQDDFVFDPIHYLPLLERKTAALDQAAPLQGWDLPEEYQTLRRLLEARMGKRGKREFVQVLRLLEHFSHQEVHHAVKDALRLGAISFDAVKHLLLCRIEGRPPRLDLDLYPYLPRVSVQTTRATDYISLLSGRVA